MTDEAQAEVLDRIDALYHTERRQVLATLIRLLGDFDLAEEALQDAFTAAVRQWPVAGVPDNPRSWLISTGRFKGVDRIRRSVRFDAVLARLATETDVWEPGPSADPTRIEDDQLRLIFTCCHPALSPDAQVAMTLREVCGLATEEIATAFLASASTVAQRIVRAKAKIRDARIPFEVPQPPDLSDRLEFVARVVYLVFNEGYMASSGRSPIRQDLADEAIRLGRLLVEQTPDPELSGLLALMLLHNSRRRARTATSGRLVPLAEQDRSRWDHRSIREALTHLRQSMTSHTVGPYALQASIAAVHARAPDANSTDWARIADLYDLLARADPSPVVRLNRAVAVAMRDGPQTGLDEIDDILRSGELTDYQPAHSARADLLQQLGQTGAARAAYQRALELTHEDQQRARLRRRLRDIRCGTGTTEAV